MAHYGVSPIVELAIAWHRGCVDVETYTILDVIRSHKRTRIVSVLPSASLSIVTAGLDLLLHLL